MYGMRNGVVYSKGAAVKETTVNAATYTILDDDHFVSVEYTDTGIVTITLPQISALTTSANAARVFIIKDTDGNAATNNITINRAGSDTIDGATSVEITADYGVVILAGSGTEYKVID